MKFKIGQELFYVCPYVFIIEKIKIDFFHDEYYCDNTYAMYREEDLFEQLADAQNHAVELLQDFYTRKINEITIANPDTKEDKLNGTN